MMRHCTLYIEQGFNKSINKLLLSCFHQIPFINIFLSHDLYISNKEKDLFAQRCMLQWTMEVYATVTVEKHPS